MGIFSSIKNAIFGGDEEEAKAAEAPAATAAPGTPAPKPAVVSNVDVVAKLSAMPGAENLNWQSSIVDLFKVLGLDPTYANRKELAEEMGRTDYEGTAEDNIWLHKVTMQQIALNGGTVPSSMTD
ncbi:DUF3597 domain-containing protein [Parerythrobacter jejuensis]|uniref:DUF3597 family protein n=1 Tax=Parerythrobacter jejuensis TaxID=795812 RepID=A0A845AS04_9SPHN|nr:DUF3597 domain-containing protein [Parerythrobacter jejuensis]MXP31715.1 DUF3597 family protein [Parerythrobacter jejuensis]